MLTIQQIQQHAEAQRDYVVQTRRTLHRFGETGGHEIQTNALICAEAEALGLPVEQVGCTGLIATLDSGKPGPHIALRADMDALPMQEAPENLAGPRVCLSENPNGFHGCGHDAHTAMLLGAMRILADTRETLRGVIYFCFEEGEECSRGFGPMLEALSRRTVDTCWAIHVYAELESGKICLDPGPRMAGGSKIDITVSGQGGHASRPDQTCNPVVCAAAIVTNAAALWANRMPIGKTVTYGITTIRGGVASNIIPDTATIEGTMRFFDACAGQQAIDLVKETARHTAALYGCTVSFGKYFEVASIPVVNNPHYARLAQQAAAAVLPEGAVVSCDPWFGSESFSRYQERYPGVMAHLGIANREKGSGAPHHNARFDVDEDVLPLGVMATLAYVNAVMQA